jgi:hypothetical protein
MQAAHLLLTVEDLVNLDPQLCQRAFTMLSEHREYSQFYKVVQIAKKWIEKVKELEKQNQESQNKLKEHKMMTDQKIYQLETELQEIKQQVLAHQKLANQEARDKQHDDKQSLSSDDKSEKESSTLQSKPAEKQVSSQELANENQRIANLSLEAKRAERWRLEKPYPLSNSPMGMDLSEAWHIEHARLNNLYGKDTYVEKPDRIVTSLEPEPDYGLDPDTFVKTLKR